MIALGVDGHVELPRQPGCALAAEDGGELEDDPADADRDRAGHQHSDRGLVAQGRRCEREPGDQQRDGEADPRQGRAADDLSGPDALRQLPEAEADGAERADADAGELAGDEAEDDAPGDR